MTRASLRRHRRGQRGFTMVELMVTLVVTTFGLMGLLALNTTFAHGGSSAYQSQEAVTIGQRALEDLRSKRTTDLVTALTGSTTAALPISRTAYESLAGRNGVTYTVDVDVTAVTATLWRTRVVVHWTDDSSGRAKQLALELLRASTEAM